jgi:hypothetical protein
MKIRYHERLQLPDWEIKGHLSRWIFDGKCPACGRADLPPELHHNSKTAYANMPHERPDDVVSFCTFCHALFELGKKYRAEYIAWAQAQQERIDLFRVRVEDLREFFDGRLLREITALLDEAEERANMLLAMNESGKLGAEWQRRAA